MKTNRDLQSTSYHWSVHVPVGADVMNSGG